MSDVLSLLKSLHRPRLLVRTARIGLPDYRRNRDLKKLIKSETPPSPATALFKLLEAEARAEECRISIGATYSALSHISLLIAIMGEAQLLRPANQA